MTTTTTATNMHLTPATRALRVGRAAAVTTAAAIATNLVVFSLARSRNVDFRFPTPGSTTGTRTVNSEMVVLVTFATLLAGWGAVALAVRHHRPTLATMAIVGAVVALVSCVAPLTIDAGVSVKVTLASLHLIAGLCYVAGIVGLQHGRTGADR